MLESWFSQADAVLLARFQFAFTVAFHIIFPAFTIGLASFLAVLEGLYLKTRNPVYQKLFRYWVKIFAVAFGMGVVSGIVMSYQFGTNWAVFSDKAGPVIGPLMGYEVLTAFFLEAGFLGVMLFGMNKVGERLHFFATLMVAVGTAISAFWILSVNSWMQTPAGFAMNEQGQFIVTSWFEAIFNPSFPYRLAHMLLAAYLTTAFVVGAVGAWHLLKDSTSASARKMFSMAMWMALIVAPLQVFVGDLHGLNTQEHQPAKVAAMEGHFETQSNAPLYLFGLPNQTTAEVDYAVKIPGLASLILQHDINAEVTGLDQFPRDEWPPVAIVFWAFRIMVGIGVLMMLIGLWSGFQRLRGGLYQSKMLHRSAVLMGPLGFVAVIAGWVVTEVGRQPWVIQGLLRTSEAVSPVDAVGVGASLLAFIIVYFLVFGAGTVYILRKMAGDPEHTHIPDYARIPMAAERLYHEEK
ncbi:MULTISPECIES: cytochrome ubiquinol oxidase subunit I [Idiomarinaceae]|uniref:Cytochrome ubiquinol oxidase subunit I n=2 Tax=Pseudidiomarina TaxID=2800384 RepID=A0AB39X6V5_9GAMM|nr:MULTISPECIES: cytochrome ubiquinol oxidase subunit I [Idiomarinaceae]MDX1526352.1 cytochrome ubiquinol oxidase subunit I [Pseudidiomarina maritima]MDT7526534.1 cytochrome ubiquinol oxidase subunit I [Pseudidiomarina sp. GXY010]MRJ42831.1 cytochrome ubiquinol oxidase subunit I [Idiomarina sp. FeN1]NCU58381.1 cytochrome ubiquinol oxidase subunit I [Idiomarina sp. FenA--70]NCU61079.1 cytochrome ubiquinol oxidase subunit I [Idiomarina sp. FenBw--71]